MNKEELEKEVDRLKDRIVSIVKEHTEILEHTVNEYEKLIGEIREDHAMVYNRTKENLRLAQRIIRIVKATVNGIKIEGEDSIEGMNSGLS